MKRLIITSLLSILLFSNISAQCFNGTWHGVTAGGPYSLPLVFHIEQTADSITVTWDSPTQKSFDLPATAIINGDTLSIDLSIIRSAFEGTLDGDDIVGEFNQGGKIFSLRLTQNDDAPYRPQEALIEADVNKPYHIEDVTFTNGDITLAGTLTLPNAGNYFPAVVLVVGSGSLDRDENIFGHKGHLLLADALSRHGFAVLRYDKRGVGASTGGKPTDPTDDLAGDAMAAVRYVSARPEVDASHIGILGHSEGGIIAIKNAAKYPDELAFIVSMAGVGLPIYEFNIRQQDVMNRMMHVERSEEERHLVNQVLTIVGTESDTTAMREHLRNYFATDPVVEQYVELYQAQDSSITASDVIEAMVEEYTTEEYVKLMQDDPTENLKSIKCPMLAVNGALDCQVGSEDNLGAIARYVPHATVKSYENLNHLFQTCSGWDGSIDFAGISETMAPQVIQDIVTWLQSVVKQ